ncbi:hypothetical protein FA15DRAFT_139609 [Coprinopsis marcescibilis]|uniref:YDG domain-containing protein n=1 Tax=Coprinopsis marcescibilis TaxID=230819 RepID=A0A5C3KIV1_COPMA|nr:hypothetical protein FA15DRAFT_139609 [Coprinopsis marcescibilis]
MGPISGFLSCTTEMGQAGPSRLQPSACRSVTQQAHSIAPTATTNVSTQRSWFAASTATTYAIPRHQPYSRSLPYAEDAVLELRQKYPARQWPAVRQAGDNFLAAELAIVTQSHRPGQLSGIFQAEAGSSFVSAASTADTMVDKYTREYQQQLYTSSAMHLGQCYGTTSAAAALSASLPHALGAANAGSYNHDMRWKLQLGSHWAATPRTGHSFSTVGSSSLAIATPPNTTFASTLGVNPVRDVPRKQLEVRWPTILQTGNDFAASASSSSSISPSGLNTTSFANLLNVNPMPKARQLSPVSTFAAGMKLPTNDKLTNTPKKEKAPNPNKGVNSEYGEIPGYPVGALFEGRVKCCHAKVHRLTMGGIHRGPDGAYSIVLSGVYGDDVDKGEEILYTGTNGGGYAKDGKQTGKVDQSFDNPSNASLAVNIRTGKPVRVVRRIKSYQSNSSKPTYRYDGLYKVVKAYMDVGIKGNMICRFELKRLEGQPPLPTTGAQL